MSEENPGALKETVEESPSKAEDDGNKIDISSAAIDENLSYEQRSNPSDIDGCNDIEEVLLTKKSTFKTARDNLKKINSMVKSKVDAIGRVPILRGKKTKDKQDKESKRNSSTPENKQESKALSHRSPSQSPSQFTNEDEAAVDTLCEAPVAEGSAKTNNGSVTVLDDDIDFDACIESNIVKPVTSDQNSQSESLCSVNDISATQQVSLMVLQPDDLINLQTEPNSAESTRNSAELNIDEPISNLLVRGNCLKRNHSNRNSAENVSPALDGKDRKSYITEGELENVSSEQTDTFESTRLSKDDTIRSTISNVSISVNRGCLEGVGPAVPVDFINPVANLDADAESISEYHKFYLRSMKQAANESHRGDSELRASQHLENVNSDIIDEVDEDFDDPYCSSDDDGTFTDNEDFWGSEFDETPYQDEILTEAGPYDLSETPDKPLPPKPEKKAFFSRIKSISNEAAMSEELNPTCLPVTINAQKHPAPMLPPQPPGLTQNQIKRRLVVDSIVTSERSYLASLERLVTEYEKTIMEFISQPKSHVRIVFLKIREIIFHHQMFQIELAECVKVWDQEEKIGDIFTGSFSKTMLITSYSCYVNSFAAAMDEIRSLQRRRQAFHDFLLKQEKLSSDRLSIFGMMVKPVQRFPQFIMFLQDLIKYTPHHHDDRMALQLALTELDNVAYRLNERKRQSEQTFLARQIVQQLIKQKVQHVFDLRNLDMDPTRRLIRNDSIEQMVQNGELKEVRCKNRRLILLNDHVLCVKVIHKEQAGTIVERYALRWVAKLKDLELADGKSCGNFDQDSGSSQLLNRAEDDPFHLLLDLREMVHDSIILQHITTLISQLKRSYAGHGLRDGLIQEIYNDLQHMVQIKEEQLRLVNNCSIILQDSSRSDKPHYVLQTEKATTKLDWCIDFLIAKLALDKSNNLSWYGMSGSDGSDFDVIPAYFIKHVPVDVPKKYTKIKCAVPVSSVMNSSRNFELQHLWVCSSSPVCGQVSILAMNNSRPALIESFIACNCEIMAVELIPGLGIVTNPEKLIFAEDTVWIATCQNQILVFPSISQNAVHRRPLAVVPTSLPIFSMMFVDDKLFCGSSSGSVIIYCRDKECDWSVLCPETLSFGNSCVKLLFVHKEFLWLSCDNKLCQLEITSLQTQTVSELSANREAVVDQVVKSGVGIWVSFHDDSVIKLFHMETMENIQEIDVRNFVSRIRTEKFWATNLAPENLTISCLAVSRGLLWIGTSLGIVLTVPIPRLSDGVPLYRGSPKLSFHAHKSPVRFFILLPCSSGALNMSDSNLILRNSDSRKHSLQNGSNQIPYGQESDESLQVNLVKQLSVDEILSLDCENLSESDHSNILKQEMINKLSDSFDNNTPDIGSQTFGDKIEKFTGMGASSVELRNKIRPKRATMADRKSRTLDLSSDFTQDINTKSRNYSRSYIDLTSSETCEVEVLYKALLEDSPESSEFNNIDSSGILNANDRKLKSTDSKLEEFSSRLSSHETVSCRQTSAFLPQFASFRASQSGIKIEGGNLTDLAKNLTLPVSGKPSLLEFQSKSAVDAASSHQESKTTGLTSARKTNSNAVLVVSGGDGYCDLDTSRKEIKMEDACVLMWIQKIY